MRTVKTTMPAQYKLSCRYDKTKNIEVLSPTIFFLCLCLIFINVDKKLGKQYFLFLHIPHVMRKYKMSSDWHFIGMSDRPNHTKIYLCLFTVYTDIFCTVPTKFQSTKQSSANELLVGTGIVFYPLPEIHRRTLQPGFLCRGLWNVVRVTKFWVRSSNREVRGRHLRYSHC